MSEQNSAPNPEMLQRVLLFADAYQKGTEQRKAMFINANSDHEDNVKAHWKDALTAYFKRDIRVTSQQINYRTTRTTFSLSLSDSVRCTAIRFLASHFDWPLDQVLQRVKNSAEQAVQDKKSAHGRWGLIFLPLFLLLPLYAWLNDHAVTRNGSMAVPITLLLAGLIFLAVVLLTARGAKLKNTFKNATDPGEALETACDVCAAGPFRNASKALLAVSAAVIVGAGGLMVYRNLPPSLDIQVQDVVTGYNSSVPTEQLDRLLVKNGTLIPEGVETIQKSMVHLQSRPDHRLQLAVYANERVSAGYPEEEARLLLTDEIGKIILSNQKSDTERKLLTQMLEKVPWSISPLFDCWLTTGNKDDADMTAVIGGGLRPLKMTEKLDYARRAQAAGMPYDALLAVALTDEEITQLREQVYAETDPGALLFLARIYGESQTDPAIVVPLLSYVRQQGLKLGNVFPSGIQVSMNLEPLNLSHKDDDVDLQLPQVCKYLALTRTEKIEPLEHKFSQPSSTYDGNDKKNPDNFTVTVNTAMMDRLPDANFPATLDDCTMLIVSDMCFVYDGCITETTTTTYSRSTSRNSTSVFYYPTYARVYRIIIAERESVLPQYTAASLVVNSEEVRSMRSSNTWTLQSEIRSKYLAKPNNTWASQTLDTLATGMDQASWNSVLYYLMYLNTDSETPVDQGVSNEL